MCVFVSVCMRERERRQRNKEIVKAAVMSVCMYVKTRKREVETEVVI